MDNKPRQRAFAAVLQSAVMRWETLVTLGVTAALFVAVPELPAIPFWQPWFWLVLGGGAQVAFIASALTDEDAAREAINREFEAKFDLRRIKSPISRQHLQSAMEYRAKMGETANMSKGALRTSLYQTVAEVGAWINQMYELALHIDSFSDNELLERDRKAVPQQLRAAEQRLALEADPNVKADLQKQIDNLRLQQSNLERAINSAKRAEIQLQTTLTSLGTIYTQMSVLGTKEVDSARAQRLREDIKDEVHGLQDTIEAMEEVQNQRLTLRN
jgi:hypothetical protein